MTKITVTVGETQLQATLDDTPAGRDFAAMLPLELRLSDYHGIEKVADLPRKLDTTDAPARYAAKAGDITLYAPWGKNFVNTIANAAKKRDVLKVVDDQRGRPTSCEHLASLSMKLIEAKARGTFHLTDGGECTWYDFAKRIAAHANPDCQVNPCTSDEYPTPAKRPGYSVLDLSKTEAITGPMPSWQDNLKQTLKAFSHEDAQKTQGT